MNGGHSIIDLHAGRAAATQPVQTAPVAPQPVEVAEPAPEPFEFVDRSPWADRAAPIVATILALGWLAAAGWMLWPLAQAGQTPVQWLTLAAAVLVPLVLIALVMLIVQRSGTAEHKRFARAARQMRDEAASLDAVVAALSERLDLGRSALREQADRLIAQGDAAAERLAAISNGIAHETAAIDAHTHKLIQSTSAARADMSVLLASLPKAAKTTREITTGIQDAGGATTEAIATLEQRLEALTARGREVDTLAGGAAERLAAHLERVDSTSTAASARLETASATMADAIDAALARAAGAVDESGKALAMQGDAITATLHAGRSAIAHSGGEAIDQLSERVTAMETAMHAIAARLEAQQAAGQATIDALMRGVDAAEARLSQLDETGAQRTVRLAESIAALRERAEAMNVALAIGGERADKLRDKAEATLVALDANAREIDETLPAALARLDTQLAAVREMVPQVGGGVEALVAPSEAARNAVAALAEIVADQQEKLSAVDVATAARLTQVREESTALAALVDELTTRTAGFADSAAPRLVESLLRVRDTATQASEKARAALAEVIPESAQMLADASGNALDAAVGDIMRSRIEELSRASEAAVAAASRASDQLMRQMVTIAETTAQVEHRFAEARSEREAADADNFARRVSLLLEALNSTAIDVTKIFSAEVADTAWSSYLRGDRGVFTRRAVQLLDNQEAREIGRLYDENTELRGMVNRYIHDFEGMLRTVLASRDGTPLGVTLLSSDMGKLYVALAQAIERLRT